MYNNISDRMAKDFDPHTAIEGKDKELDGIIRPQDLQDFTGQDKIVANLIQQVVSRSDHLLTVI